MFVIITPTSYHCLMKSIAYTFNCNIQKRGDQDIYLVQMYVTYVNVLLRIYCEREIGLNDCMSCMIVIENAWKWAKWK